jgi:hypothetical protein
VNENPWDRWIPAVLSTIIAVIAVYVSIQALRRDNKRAIRDATEAIFREWWSEDMRQTRRYFFYEFLPKFRGALKDKGMKDVDEVLSGQGVVSACDRAKPTRLCYFFDRVGWLGAANLIDVDYLLGPMQHTLRRTWLVMGPLIRKERERTGPGKLDPVYQLGFEWLYKRSSERSRHQSELLARRFKRPAILPKEERDNLREQIDQDERDFKKEYEAFLT